METWPGLEMHSMWVNLFFCAKDFVFQKVSLTWHSLFSISNIFDWETHFRKVHCLLVSTRLYIGYR